MRQNIRVLIIAAAAIVGLALAASVLRGGGCDAACQVKALGWQVLERGPTLWFRNAAGRPDIEIAIAAPARPPDSNGIGWARARLATRKPFGPLNLCLGHLPDFPREITYLACNVPPGPEGPREGGMYVVPTAAGYQVIGIIVPAKLEISNRFALRSLPGEKRADAMAHAARSAIALYAGGGYYIAKDAGPPVGAIDAVYHLWNWQLVVNEGNVDKGSDFVLFKNGELWRDPGAGPRDINPARFREARWNDCGTWRHKGGGIAVTMNGFGEELMPAKNFERYAPATGTAQHPEGIWHWGKSTDTAFLVVVSDKWIKLHADGRFEQNGSAGAIGKQFMPIAGVISSYKGVPPQESHSSGHYSIDGYTLHLSYEGGFTASELFYWAGDGKSSRYAMLHANGVNWLQDGLH